MTANIQKRLLVLAGTGQARSLCAALAGAGFFSVTASLAGGTELKSDYPVPVRTGGFGGPEGLMCYLQSHKIDCLIDSTHPFAAKISRSALYASEKTGTRLLRLERPPWPKPAGCVWLESEYIQELFNWLPSGAKVFAALGRSAFSGKIAALISSRRDIQFAVRAVNAPVGVIPNNICNVVTGYPDSAEAESMLMSELGIDCLLCRNSGGADSYFKVEAAQKLNLPVYLLARPRHPPQGAVETFSNVNALVRAVQEEVCQPHLGLNEQRGR